MAGQIDWLMDEWSWIDGWSDEKWIIDNGWRDQKSNLCMVGRVEW